MCKIIYRSCGAKPSVTKAPLTTTSLAFQPSTDQHETDKKMPKGPKTSSSGKAAVKKDKKGKDTTPPRVRGQKKLLARVATSTKVGQQNNNNMPSTSKATSANAMPSPSPSTSGSAKRKINAETNVSIKRRRLSSPKKEKDDTAEEVVDEWEVKIRDEVIVMPLDNDDNESDSDSDSDLEMVLLAENDPLVRNLDLAIVEDPFWAYDGDDSGIEPGDVSLPGYSEIDPDDSGIGQ